MIYRVLMDGQDILNYQEKPYLLVSPTLTMELNTAGSFEFTMPPAHALYEEVRLLASTISVYEDETLLWFGRPVEVKTDFYKQKTIYCEGALAFFNDSVQRLREYERISLHTFFRTVIENHNAQVNEDRQFTVGTITVPDKRVYRKLNYESTFNVLKRQCLEAEGGYLFLRQEAGVNYIDWYAEAPYSSNQPVEFGLNMLDLSRVFDGSGIATCVIPLGDTDEETGAPLTVAEVNGGSDVIESAAVADYGYITRAVTFSGVSHADTLFADGLEYLESTQFDNMTIECTAAELHWQNENYGLFRVGQKIHCRSIPHLLDRNFDLLKITLRLDTAEKQITLGSTKKETLTEITKETLANSESIDSRIDSAISDASDSLTDYMDDSIGVIESTIDDLNGIPDVDDYRDNLGGLLDDINDYISDPNYEYADEPIVDTLLDELGRIQSGLDGAESYSDLDDLLGQLSEFLTENEDYLDSDSGDYDSWLDQTNDLWNDLGSAENPLSIHDMQSDVSLLQNDCADLWNQLSGLQMQVEELKAAVAASEQWVHQIDGETVTSGTVNFVTTNE